MTDANSQTSSFSKRNPFVSIGTQKSGFLPHLQKEEKKQKARFKRNESKNDSELRKLKKENARLQEELSLTQQTPREEVTCKGEITGARKRVVQLRLMFNSQVSERMLKDKQLVNLRDKVTTINMELGEGSNGKVSAASSPRAAGGSGSGLNTPVASIASHASTPDKEVNLTSSSLQSLSKMTTRVQQEHERLKGLLVDTDNNITEIECYQLMLQHRKRQYMLTQSGMESQYKSLRKQLNILDRQHHEIELNVRTLEHGEVTAITKAEDILKEIKKYEKQREELKTQQRQKKEKQERIQEYMQSRELNRQNLKKEMNGGAFDGVNQNEEKANDSTVHFVDVMFEKFMDTLVERVGIGSNLSAMLQKLENMNDTQEEVLNRKVETEMKLQNLEKEKVQLQQQLQEIAVNGTDFSFRRLEIDEIEEKTHTSAKKFKGLLAKLENCQRMLAGVQIGIEAISMKLDNLKVKAPNDQQKVEAKPDKSVVPLGIQSMTGVGTDHKGEADKNTEEHEDPLLRQLDAVEQKLNKIVDSLAVSYMRGAGGDNQDGEADGAQAMSWLSSDLKKAGLEMTQQGQYNMRVNLITPTGALPSAPSSAGAFDAEALSDDSDLDSMPMKKSSQFNQSSPNKVGGSFSKKDESQPVYRHVRSKSRSAININFQKKHRQSRVKQASMFAGI